MREQDGKPYGWFMEAAVVVQLADGHAERFPAVGVLRFDQGVPVLNPQVAEHGPDLPGPVFLPADGDAFGCQVVPVAMDKCGFGAFAFPWKPHFADPPGDTRDPPFPRR